MATPAAGRALSVKSVTGVPIKFIGTGEQVDALEDFPSRAARRPDPRDGRRRLARRGGASGSSTRTRWPAQEERLKAGEFTLDDFKKMLAQTRRLGPLGKVLGMIPGMGGMQEMLAGADLEEYMNRLFGIIDSMTPDERRNPSRMIDQSRRKRIAAGRGSAADGSRRPRQAVRRHGGDDEGHGGPRRAGSDAGGAETAGPDGHPAARIGRPKGDTGKRLTADERRKQKKQREKEARRRRRDGT